MKTDSHINKLLLFALLAIFLMSSCSTSLLNQGRKLVEQEQYDQAIDIYYQEIATNPENRKTWNELGFAYYKSGDLIKAEEALKNASKDESGTFLCQGLVFEARNKSDDALKAFASALSLSPNRKTRALIQSHMNDLIRKSLNREISKALIDEAEIDVASIPENTLAVVNFDGSLLPPETAPLAFGLAEFTSADLSKVKSLKLVERLKIELLFQELKLASSEYSSSENAPRVGRLLGSRNIVTAKLTSAGNDIIRLDGAVVNSVEGSAKTSEPSQAPLHEIFKIQKEFVFSILENLGIELTQAERDSIMQFPTESYLAFLAYSKGLQHASRGDYKSAQVEFNTAVELDNNFTQASQELELSNTSFMNQQFGASSTFDLENSFIQDNLTTGNQSDTWLSGLLNQTDILDPEGEDPNTTTKTPPVTSSPKGSAAVRGNLDGD